MRWTYRQERAGWEVLEWEQSDDDSKSGCATLNKKKIDDLEAGDTERRSVWD